MPSIQANPLFSRAEIGILACSKCRKPKRLTCIEPASPGFDIRTFECSECSTIERFNVAISEAAFSRPWLDFRMKAQNIPAL
jgi:hypothetical protein